VEVEESGAGDGCSSVVIRISAEEWKVFDVGLAETPRRIAKTGMMRW